MDDLAPGVEKSETPTPEKRVRSQPSRESSRERSRKRRSRSRDRRRKRSLSRSRSASPHYRAGVFRGNRNNNNRFGRRSPFRGQRNFNNRFNDRRSRSRDRFDNNRGRRFDRSRRSRSESPMRNNSYMTQQDQAVPMYTDGYGNYGISNTTAQQQCFDGTMAQMGSQFNSYDFQGGPNFAPPAPAFNVGISCPAPPGMSESWLPPQTIQPEESEEDKLKREAAVAEEKKRQRDGLKKQRDQYVGRSEKMKRELKELKQQKADLSAGLGKNQRSPSPKTNGFIKENEKLQSQISTKLSEILKVIDILNGIIGKDEDEASKRKTKKSRKSDSDSSPERIKSELLESMKRKKEAEEKKLKVNYIVFDPELHWCKNCQVFPKTAKDYLAHLHTKEHIDKSVKNAVDAPWRNSFSKANGVSSFPDAPTKRAPIRGLQFFEPATAWFCKLCDVFMGDTWCASLHLKSELHNEQYAKFAEKEPKFEEKWLESRKKALETSEKNGNAPASADAEKRKDEKKSKKKKSKREGRKDKKKRKGGKKRKRGSSSSSSSNSEESGTSSGSEESGKKNDSDRDESKNSYRVKMRNLSAKKSENDEKTGKWTMVSETSGKPIPPPAPSISKENQQEKKKDDQIIGQWSTLQPVISQEEKRLLANLKGRLKNNQAEVSENQSKFNRRDDGNDKSRDRDRSRSRDRSRGRSRGYRGRRSRSRSRSRSRGRYSRRYSRSRSGSRSRRRVERPIVKFPAEPRLPPSREEKKLPARSYVISKKEESSSNVKKVMPMIGKMPVFKKQLSDKKTEEPLEEIVEPAPAEEDFTEVKKTRDDTWDDYMPDPLQYSALMGAPPPPPVRMEEPEVVPPGLDPEQDSEFIPQPISDAPIARKGPLPKDFQDTLDLLYDGDTPKPIVIEQKIIEPLVMPVDPPDAADGPQMIMAEDLSQHALIYGYYGQSTEDSNAGVIPEGDDHQQDNDTAQEFIDENNDEIHESVEKNVDEDPKNQRIEMDDLAMLGIDVNDVGSGMW